MRYFEKSEFSSIFRCTYCSHIIEIRANVRNFAWHFVPRTTKFRSKFRLGKRNFAHGTKCQAKFRTLARNFNDMGTIAASKYRGKFAFFEISHNFGKFRRNLLSLILHSTVDFEKKTFLSNINNLATMNFRYAASTSNRDQKPSVR